MLHPPPGADDEGQEHDLVTLVTLPRKKMMRSTQRSTVHSSYKSPGERSYSERMARPNPTLVPQAPIPMGKRTSALTHGLVLATPSHPRHTRRSAEPSHHPPLRPGFMAHSLMIPYIILSFSKRRKSDPRV